MTIQNLYYFVEATKDRSLTATAKRLYIAQQSLSGHIKRLEEHYGVTLFNRKPILTLTPEGELLLAEAEKILASDNSLKRKFTAINRLETPGTINVICGMARTRLFIPNVLNAFFEKYPSVRVFFLNVSDYDGDPFAPGSDIDFVISHKHSEDPDISYRELINNDSFILVSEQLLKRFLGDKIDDFLERTRNGAVVSDFFGMPLIIASRDGKTSWLAQGMPELDQLPHVNVDSSILDIPLCMCKAGGGITCISRMYLNYILSSHSAEYLSDIHIFPLLFEDGRPYCNREYLSYAKSRPMSQYARDFMDIVVEVFAEMKRSGNYPD